MDILISSNLERLLYDLSGSDDKYIKSLMDELKQVVNIKLILIY